MQWRWWDASSEPKPQEALSTCSPYIFVRAVRMCLGYSAARSESCGIELDCLSRLIKASLEPLTAASETGQGQQSHLTDHPDVWTILIVVCHWGFKGCVLHSIAMATHNWHTHLEIENEVSLEETIRSSFHLQTKWAPADCFFICIVQSWQLNIFHSRCI